VQLVGLIQTQWHRIVNLLALITVYLSNYEVLFLRANWILIYLLRSATFLTYDNGKIVFTKQVKENVDICVSHSFHKQVDKLGIRLGLAGTLSYLLHNLCIELCTPRS